MMMTRDEGPQESPDRSSDVRIPPTVTEYKTYVDNWKNHIYVPQIWKGAPVREKSPFGTKEPVGRCGQFAVVYIWENDAGNKKAVRFFTRPIDSRDELRYLAMKLVTERSKYFVDFEYIKDGLWTQFPDKKEFSTFPLVLMDMAEGLLLDEYIEKKLGHPNDLLDLTIEWYFLMNDLAKDGISHGDLQHGNIIVSNDGRIKLVDYDGVYIKIIEHLGSKECGHPNYNHPKRMTVHYGPDMDQFASLVIYFSIILVTIYPDLWRKYHNDENLLFTRSDFQSPESSRLFGELAACQQRHVKSLMDQLILLCKNDDPVPGNRLDLPYITQEEREEILEFRKKEMEKFENAKKIENGYDHEVESIQAESIKNQKGLASDNTTDDKWLRTQSIVLAEVPPKEEPNITKEKRSAKKVDEEKADAHLKRIQRRKAQFENQISKYKNWIIIIISLTIPIVIVSIVFGIAFIINPNEIANVVAIDFFLAVLCLIIIIYYYLRNKIQSINQELDEL